MPLSVTAYPGFKKFVSEAKSRKAALHVAKSMLKTGRHFYAEPETDGRWSFHVDAEHQEALAGFITEANGEKP